MADVLSMTIQLDGYQDLIAAADAGEKLNQSLENIERTASRGPTIFNNYTRHLRTEVQDAVDLMDSAKEKLTDPDTKMNSYTSELRTGEYEFGAKTMTAISHDLSKLQALSKTLNGFHFSESDIHHIEKQLPALNRLIRSVGNTFGDNTSRITSLSPDKYIRSAVMATEEYQGILESMSSLAFFQTKTAKGKQRKIPKGQNLDNFMESLVDYSIVNVLDAVQRYDYMQHFKGMKHSHIGSFESYEDMLPKAFKKARTGLTQVSNADFASLLTNNDFLTRRQKKSLGDVIQENTYMAQAAELAGIASRSKGTLSVNRHVTRQQVNAAAGYLYQMIENGARGMPMYGIKDVNNPDDFERILNKNNKLLNGSMSAARFLSDHFDWLTPLLYGSSQINDLNTQVVSQMRTKAQAKNPKVDLNRINNSTRQLGNIHFDATPNAYQVTHYSLDDIAQHRSWQSGDPYSETDRAHKMVVNGSMGLDKIMRTAEGGRVLPHNSALDYVFYIDLDPRLIDESTPQDVRDNLMRQVGELYTKGTSVKIGGQKTKFKATRINPKSLGIEMVRADIVDNIENKQGLKNFFTGGITPRVFDNSQDFAKFMEYSSKIATEGVDIRQLYGKDALPDKDKIVIVDMAAYTGANDKTKVPGLNGASYISSGLTGGNAFQARMFGYKGVLNSVNMGNVVEAFTGNKNGEIVVPGYGGTLQKITKDTQMVINMEDLKGAGLRFGKNASYDEIQKIIAQNIADNSIYVNRTANQAGRTHLTWIPAQLAQTLDIDANQADVFQKTFWDIFRSVGTPTGAAKYIFADDSALSTSLLSEGGAALLNKKPYKNRIEAFRTHMIERMSRGDLPMPEGVQAHRGMLAPWAINVFSDAINEMYKRGQIGADQVPRNMWDGGWVPEAGPITNGKARRFIDKKTGQVIEDLLPKDANGQELSSADIARLRIGENDAVFSKSMATLLGISRFPAQIQSAQKINNRANDKALKSTNFRKLVQQLGMDPNAIYLAQDSPLLGLMQGADFDGDMSDIIDLMSKDGTTMQDMMNKIWDKTVTYHNDLVARAQLAPDERDRILEKQKRSIFGDQKKFDPRNALDVGRWVTASMMQSIRMGGPNAISRNAMQMDITPDIAKELIMAFDQYDTNSTSAKTGYFFETPDTAKNILFGYKSWDQFNNQLMKSRDSKNNIDYGRFLKTNLFKMNLPSIHMSGNILASLLARSTAAQNGVQLDNGVSWSTAFANSTLGNLQRLKDKGYLNEASESALTKETRQFITGMESLLLGELRGDYVIASQHDADALLDMRTKAINAEMRNGHNHQEAEYIIGEFGGTVLSNLLDPNYGLTDEHINDASDSIKRTMRAFKRFGGGYSTSHLDFDSIAKMALSSKRQYERVDPSSALGKLKYLPHDAIQDKLDNTGWSVTSLIHFAEDPVDWVVNQLGQMDTKRDTGTNAHTMFGHAAEDMIQDYFDIREKLVRKQLKDDPNATRALPEAVKRQLLEDIWNGKEIVDPEDSSKNIKFESFSDRLRALGKDANWDDERIEAMIDEITSKPNGGHIAESRLQKKYRRFKAFMSSQNQKGILSILPELANEYIGSEDDLTISKLGEQLGDSSKSIDMHGHQDLLFRMLDKDNKLNIIDIKTYGGLEDFTMDKKRAVAFQLQMYANADEFRQGGPDKFKNNGIGALNVLLADAAAGQNMYAIDSSQESIAHAVRAASRVIQTIQNFSTSGLGLDAIQRASLLANKLMFSGGIDDEFAKELQLSERAIKQMRGTGISDAGALGGVLTSHEDYKEAMERTQKLSKSIQRKLIPEDEKTIGNIWDSYHATIRGNEDTIATLEARGNFAEAARLQRETNDIKDLYYRTVPEAAIRSYSDLADQIERTNKGMIASKEAKGLTEQWNDLAKAVQNANNDYNELSKLIDESKGTGKKIKDERSAFIKQQKDIAKAKASGTMTDEQKKNEVSEEEYNAKISDFNSQLQETAARVKGYKQNQRLAQKLGLKAEEARQKFQETLSNQADEIIEDEYDTLSREISGEVGPDKKVPSIKQQLDNYKLMVGRHLGNIEEFRKSGLYSDDKALALSMQAQALLTDDNMEKLRQRYIGDALTSQRASVNDIIGASDTRADIQAAVAKKQFDIDQSKATIAKIFEGENLNLDQQHLYDALLRDLDSFDLQEYRSQLIDKAIDAYQTQTSGSKIKSSFDIKRSQKQAVEKMLQDDILENSANLRTGLIEGYLGQANGEAFLKQNYADEYAQYLKVKRLKQQLARSQSIDLDANEKLELEAFHNKQMEQVANITAALTGVGTSSMKMSELRSASLATQLKSLFQDDAFKGSDGKQHIPSALQKYIDANGKVQSGEILQDIIKDEQERQKLQLLETKSNGDIGHKINMAQLDAAKRQYNMARLQYGPTFVGRSWQYNDQQYLSWMHQRNSAQTAIDRTNAHINQLNYQRKHTDPTDTDKLALIDENIRIANNALADYDASLTQADAAMKEFSSTGGLLRTTLMNVSNAAENLLLQLGKRALQTAFKEASTFVRQFNADMLTIQAISGKSTGEMGEVRASSIKQAKELKTSVSNVTSTKAALYRQGLSDKEVEERTNAIVKFSTVTGAKITDATKGLTTAIQTGLVSNINQAMDVLTALGDSAATTAEEIEKGMQKAAASAKTAGVSYNELTSMLTIATSKTQLGGAQAGTFFQTLFSRMNRVTKEGFITDETGETTSINDVETALKTAGIRLRSSKDVFRSSFDVLRELASVWEGLSDLQKGNITYAMAGGRQANMFNTLMAGMGEDGGKLLDEYLGLADNSDNTVQSKYEVVIQGIQAAMDNLKSTFDGFVESLGSDNMITGLLNGVTGLVQGFTNLSEAGSAAIPVITALIAALGALSIKIAVFGFLKDIATMPDALAITKWAAASAGLISTVAAIGAIAGVAGTAGGIGNALFGKPEQKETDGELSRTNTNALKEKQDRRRKAVQDAINDIDNITTKYEDTFDNIPTEATDALGTAVQTLSVYFSGLTDNVNQASGSLEYYTEVAKRAKEASEQQNKTDASTLLAEAMGGITESLNTYKDTEQTFLAEHTGTKLTSDGYVYARLNNFVGKTPQLYDNLEALYRSDKDILTEQDFKDIGISLTDSEKELLANGSYGELSKVLQGRLFSSTSTLGGLTELLFANASGMSNAIDTNFWNENGEQVGNINDITDALDKYIKQTPGLKVGGKEITSYKEFASILKEYALYPIDRDEADLNDIYSIVNGFRTAMIQPRSVLNNVLEESKQTIESLRADQIETLFTDNLRPVFETMSITSDEMIKGFAQDYIGQYYDKELKQMSDEGLSSANIKKYMESFINGDRTIYDIFKPNDKNAFRYSYNGLIGFDELTEEAITQAIDSFYKSADSEEVKQQLNALRAMNFNDIANAAITNSTGLRARQSLGDLVDANKLTSKEKGYVDEYRQLFALWASNAEDINKFSEATRGVDNIEKLQQADNDLTEIMADLLKGTGVYDQDDLGRHLLSKSLGANSFTSYMEDITKYATALAEQYQVMSVDKESARSDKKLREIIAKYVPGATPQMLEDNFDAIYTQFMQNYYANSGSFLSGIDQNYSKTLSSYAKLPSNKGKALSDIVNNNPMLQSMWNLFSMYGIGFDMDENGNVLARYTNGGITMNKENPFASFDTYYTNAQINDMARQILNAADPYAKTQAFAQTNEGLLARVKATYPNLQQFVDSQGTDELIRKQLLDEIAQKEITAQRDLGLISSDFASNYTTLQTSTSGTERQTSIDKIVNSITGRADYYSALSRIANDNGALSQDYQTVAAMLGREVEDVQAGSYKYKQMLLNDKSDMDTAVREANMLRSYVSDEQRADIDSRLLESGLIWNDKTGSYIYQAADRSMYDYEKKLDANVVKYNAVNDYKNAYDLLNSFYDQESQTYKIPDNFHAQLQERTSSDFLNELSKNAQYFDFINNGDWQSVADIFSQGAYGYNAFNPLNTDYNNATVKSYYDALLKSDQSVLKNLDNNNPLKNVLGQWIGQSLLEELLPKVSQGQKLTQQDINRVRSAYSQNKLMQSYAANPYGYDYSILSGAQNLYGTEQEQLQYLNQVHQTSEQYRTSRAALAFQQRLPEYARSLSAIQEVARTGGMTEDAIAGLTTSDESIAKASITLESTISTFTSSVALAGDAADGFSTSLSNATKDLTAESKQWTLEELYDWVNTGSGKGAQRYRQQQYADLAGAANRAQNGQAFIEQLRNLDWVKNADQFKEFAGNKDVASVLYRLFQFNTDTGNFERDENGSLVLAADVDYAQIQKELDQLSLKANVEIQIDHYDDLVNLGIISKEVAENFKQLENIKLGTGGADASSAVSTTLNTFVQQSEAINAFTRLMNGGTSEADRDLVSSFFKIDTKGKTADELKTYQSFIDKEWGALNSGLAEFQNAYPEYAPFVKDMFSTRDGFFATTNGQYYFMPSTARTNQASEAFKGYVSPYQYEDQALAAYRYLTSKPNMDAASINQALSASSSDMMREFMSTMLTNPEYQNAVQNGWRQTMGKLFLESAGINYFNSLSQDYNNPDVMKYYNALLNPSMIGRTAILRGYAREDQEVKAALASQYSNINGLSIEQLIQRGTALSSEEARQLRQQRASNLLTNMYNANADYFDQETMSRATELYGTQDQRNKYVSDVESRIKTYNEYLDALALMTKPGESLDAKKMKDIAGAIGWTTDQIDSMQITSATVSQLTSDINSKQSALDHALTAIGTVIGDFIDLIAGLQSKIDQNNVFSFADIAGWVDEASHLGDTREKQKRIDDVYAMLRSSSSAEEFQTAFESSDLAWMKDKGAVKDFFSDPAIAAIFYDLFEHEGRELATNEDGSLKFASGADYDVIEARARAASSYAALGYDGMYSARMGQLDTWAQNNGALSFLGGADAGVFDVAAFNNYLAGDTTGLQQWIQSLDGGAEALKLLNTEGADSQTVFNALFNTLRNGGINSMKQFGDYSDEVKNNLEGLDKNAASALKTTSSMIKQMNKYGDMAIAANKMRGKNGKGVAGKGLKSADLKVIAGATELDEQDLKKMSAEEMAKLADSMEAAANEGYLNSVGETIKQRLIQGLESAANNGVDITQLINFKVLADGQIDASEVAAVAKSLQDAGLAELANYAGLVGTLALKIHENGEEITVETVLNALKGATVTGALNNTGAYHGGGGGGGGGGNKEKSATDKLLQNVKNRITIADHRIKMTQLQEQKYNQLGMLSNENNMIEYENTLQKDKASRLSKNIVDLRNQLKTVDRGSDDWQKLYEQILKYEEELDQTNNTITANTLKIQQNNSAIRKARTDLEDLVVQEIEARIQKQREMLSASVEMQDTILEAIRQRHQEEWDLIKKDLEKKREALEEEKSLIDKRLQMRKDAEDEAKKYEELAEYRRQLALISMDSTRTKDAAELRKKIAETEDELAWKTAEQEANAQKESLDDQIKGVEKYEQYGDEDLELLLEDANNFSTDVAKVMQMNQEDMFKWLKNNVKEYSHSLEDAQTQMVQSWEDTYKQMLGITDTYWDQVNQILSRKDIFKAFMMESDQYKNASETEKEELLYQWLDAVNSGSYLYYLRTREDWATYHHDDEEFADYVGGESGGGGGSGGSGGGPGSPNSPSTTTNNSTSTWGVYSDTGRLVKTFNSQARAQQYLNLIAYNEGYTVKRVVPTAQQAKPTKTSTNANNNRLNAVPFSEGGEVKYTGLAMVHGTPAKPEAFLDNEDRNTMRGILDSGFMQDMRTMVASFKQINTSSFVRHIYDDSSLASGARVTVGDININTNQINNEADFEELAVRIGREFVKDLSMQGLSTSKFSF